MRFLADESCDFAIVRALRDAGHDVVAVAEQPRGIPDDEVIELARADSRVLPTEAKLWPTLQRIAQLEILPPGTLDDRSSKRFTIRLIATLMGRARDLNRQGAIVQPCLFRHKRPFEGQHVAVMGSERFRCGPDADVQVVLSHGTAIDHVAGGNVALVGRRGAPQICVFARRYGTTQRNEAAHYQ